MGLNSTPRETGEDDDSTVGFPVDKHTTTSNNETLSNGSTSKKRNAFAELMASKPKQQKLEQESKPKPGNDSFKTGLLRYITQPSSFPQGTILRETEHTIVIRDLYPKALVHLLLLPKDSAFYNLTPFEAFNPQDEKHAAFLERMKDEATSAAHLAASELSRKISAYSASCATRNAAMESDDPPPNLPAGRDFVNDIKIGIHAEPSMSTLHIHIISQDMYSSALKHKKHYNSFNTPFFVGLDDFPLMDDDNLMDETERLDLINGDMKCWRCGQNFGNKFAQLKRHLEEEYDEWKKI